MVDFASTQVQAKEVAPQARRKGVHAEAAAAKPLNASPPLTADGVDKMYRYLVEIHAIAATQPRSVLASVSLTQLLAQYRQGLVGQGPS
jgi:hypothetical protein